MRWGLVWIAGWMVPRDRRRDWRRGWEAELQAWSAERDRELRGKDGEAGDARRSVPSMPGSGALAATLLRDAWAVRDIAARTERRGDGTMMRMLQWVRDAGRGLRRSPGFALLAVLTLGVGLSATTGIFAVVDHVLLRPLPYPEADRIVEVRHPLPGLPDQDAWAMSVAGFFHAQDRSRELETLGAWFARPVLLHLEGGGRRIPSAFVSAETLDILGVEARLGRLFTPQEDEPDETPVVLLAHGLWTDHFGADPGVVGQTVEVNAQRYTVVGITQPGLRLPGGDAVDLWVPWRLDRNAAPVNSHYVNTLGRLAPGSTLASAEEELRRMTEVEFPERFPGAYEPGFMGRTGFTAQVRPVRTVVLGSVESTLWLLLAAVALVLLLAAANVANLFLVRREVRGRELSIRRALGASRRALRGHLVGESMLVAGAAAGLALLLTRVGLPALLGLTPEGLPRMDEVSLDLRVVLFTLLLAGGVGLALGFLPWATGPGHGTGGARGAASGSSRMRRALVAVQLALSVVLLGAAGLMLRTAVALGRADPGFEPTGVVAFDYSLPAWEYADVDATTAFHQRVLQNVRRTTGVEAAGVINQAPMSGAPGCWAVFPEAGEPTCPVVRFVSDGYFEAMGIRLLEGRGYESDDLTLGTGALVVSGALGAALWPGEPTLGQGLKTGSSEGPYLRVSGITEEVHDQGLTESAPAIAYFPLRGAGGTTPWGPSYNMTLVVRAPDRSVEALATEVRSALAAVHPLASVREPRPLEAVVARAQLRQMFALWLLGLAGVFAVLVGSVGHYAVISYAVSRRRGEIGIRMALGADRRGVARRVVGDSLRLMAVGAAVGLVASLATNRLLRGLLYGVEPQDPLTLVAVAGLLLVVGAVAAWRPAIRAAGISPTEALRSD